MRIVGFVFAPGSDGLSQTWTADADYVLRQFVSYPRFGGRIFAGASDDPVAILSSNPVQPAAQDPISNTGDQLNLKIFTGEKFYIYPYQTASTVNGMTVQLFLDDATAVPP